MGQKMICIKEGTKEGPLWRIPSNCLPVQNLTILQKFSLESEWVRRRLIGWNSSIVAHITGQRQAAILKLTVLQGQSQAR